MSLIRLYLPSKELKRSGVEFFLADQGDRTAFVSIFWQEPHSANVIEAVCTDWPLPPDWKDKDIWWTQAPLKCHEAQPSTIDDVSAPERWGAMRTLAASLRHNASYS
jgi:hypothetical protein